MPMVFICDSHQKQWFKALADDIDALGHEPCFDQDLSGGQAWGGCDPRAIRGCDGLLAALSPQALDSVASLRETAYAVSPDKPVLAVLVAED